MKICRVYPDFQTDLKYAEHYIAKEMAKLGHTTTFITSAKYLNIWKPYLKTIDGLGYKVFNDFDVYRIRSIAPKEKTIFTNWINLYRLLFTKNRFDVLHLSGVGTFSTLIILFLDKLNRKNRPKILISDHTDTRTHKRSGRSAELYHLFFRLGFRLLGKRVSKIITFDKVGITVLSRRYHINESKFEIVPLGYDGDFFCNDPEKRNTEEQMLIGYAGKIDPKKRVDVLLNAIAKSKYKAYIKLIVVGVKDNDDYTDLLRNISKEHNLNVDFLPFVRTAELAHFYQKINLAVFPGGISVTTIEANGCGTPVIIYRSIEGLEVRVEKGRGMLFSEENELLSAIEKYYEQFITNSIDHRNIAQVTAETTSWADISKKYLSLYKN